MPLMMLPMSPGVELNLGNSLIPITGVMLLLRSVLEGNYWQALPYVPLVVGVTLVCCLLAIRWAVDQFNSETVLFRESERLDLGLWLRHLLRDREDTPNVGEALFCGVLILMVQFFMNVTLARYMQRASFDVVALRYAVGGHCHAGAADDDHAHAQPAPDAAVAFAAGRGNPGGDAAGGCPASAWPTACRWS